MVLPKTAWHAQTDTAVVKGLATNPTRGLSASEAQQRLERQGLNVFTHESGPTFLGRFLRQLRSPLVLILLIAGVVTLVIGHYVDATVILIALAINVGIGLFQEGRANKAFAKLAESQEKYAIVIRDGVQSRIRAERVVQGDLVVLSAGTTVPADVRLLEAKNLSTNESALTGEWLGVDKQAGMVGEESRITEQDNMVWMGTLITSGTGKGIAIATGTRTQIGLIAESLQDTQDPPTPLQKSIHSLAVFISYLVGGIVVVIFGLGLFRGAPIGDMLLLAIAIAVSVIPEGLPAAVTAVLAIGMEHVLSRGGLVRNLLAAETLGSTSVILTDKTGTLTQAKMKLEHVVTMIENDDDAHRALVLGVFASDAFVEAVDSGVAVRGRPMEQAIVQSGLVHGIHQEELMRTHVSPIEGQTYSLTCDLMGDESLDVTTSSIRWDRLTPTFQMGILWATTLSFNPLTVSDASDYRCTNTITSPYLTSTRTITQIATIQVLGKHIV